MGLRDAFNGIIKELNAPRFFEARWGCIRWGKLNQGDIAIKKIAEIRDFKIKQYERKRKNGIDIPSFQYADRDIAQIIKRREINKAHKEILQGA